VSSVSRWRESGHLERAVQTAGGQEAVDIAVKAMLDDACGWRLAELRKRRGMTQEQVAARMGVSVARVSQIERGDVSTQDVLNRFVTALGGTLKRLTMALFDQPITSITARSGTPRSSTVVAAVWRASCSLASRTPASRSNDFHSARSRPWSIGLPFGCVNIQPPSRHSVPRARVRLAEFRDARRGAVQAVALMAHHRL
jgi:DNA-binding XRE family transcriptional regulator